MVVKFGPAEESGKTGLKKNLTMSPGQVFVIAMLVGVVSCLISWCVTGGQTFSSLFHLVSPFLAGVRAIGPSSDKMVPHPVKNVNGDPLEDGGALCRFFLDKRSQASYNVRYRTV